jgi:5'-3' exonuclease
MHIGLLREYLEADMRPTTPLTFAFDGERAIDDFILLTIVCGNDFTPHLPSFDIGEGVLDTLLRVYREQLPLWGSYLSDRGLIDLACLERLMRTMGEMEEEVFALRAEEAARFERKKRRGHGRPGVGVADFEEEDAKGGGDDPREEAGDVLAASAADETLAAAASRLAIAASEEDGSQFTETRVIDRRQPAAVPSATLEGPASFKERYYKEKFGISYRRGIAADDAVLQQVVHSFVEALQWVLLYYFRGCPSWGWFYMSHYAPMTSACGCGLKSCLYRQGLLFVSCLAHFVFTRPARSLACFNFIGDLVDLSSSPVSFRLGGPFLPFQQLLGCLPASSSNFLPSCYRELMTQSSSPLLRFYPDVAHIKVDMNGKWEKRAGSSGSRFVVLL